MMMDETGNGNEDEGIKHVQEIQYHEGGQSDNEESKRQEVLARFGDVASAQPSTPGAVQKAFQTIQQNELVNKGTGQVKKAFTTIQQNELVNKGTGQVKKAFQNIQQNEQVNKGKDQIQQVFHNIKENERLSKGKDQIQKSFRNLKQNEHLNKGKEQVQNAFQNLQQNEVVNKGKDKVANVLGSLGSSISRFKVGFNYRNEERQMADLQSLNRRMQEDKQRHDVVRESESASLQIMKDHLNDFLQRKPNGTYAEWIEDLHPENTDDPKLIMDMDKEVDLRFYVVESDHRLLWNEVVPSREVAPRSRMFQSNEVVDLLNTDTSNNEQIQLSDPGTTQGSSGGEDLLLL